MSNRRSFVMASGEESVRGNLKYKPHEEKSQQLFYKNWVDRVGDSMKLEYIYVNEIPLEKSGKFCLVKNNIKHLI